MHKCPSLRPFGNGYRKACALSGTQDAWPGTREVEWVARAGKPWEGLMRLRIDNGVGRKEGLSRAFKEWLAAEGRAALERPWG